MPITLEGTVGGRSLEARGEARGKTEILASLLRARFADDDRIPAIAASLAARPQQEAVDLALNAPALDALVDV